MRGTRKTLKTLQLATLITLIVSVNTSVAMGYMDKEPYCGNWNILVAYDDEMAATSFWFYAPFPGGIIPVSVEMYIKYQVWRGTYRFLTEFEIEYYIVKYVQWESSDDLETLPEVFAEAIESLDWNLGMCGRKMLDNGKTATVLIAWTNQETKDYQDIYGNWHGYSGLANTDPHNRSVIIQYQEVWADDNVVMHELSHLHGAGLEDHEGVKGCVMDYGLVGAPLLYWEPLYPVPPGGSALIQLADYGKIQNGFLSYEWCDECKRTIANNKNFWGSPESKVMELPDGMEGLEYHYPLWLRILIILALIGLPTAGVLLFVYAIDKRSKRREKKTQKETKNQRLIHG